MLSNRLSRYSCTDRQPVSSNNSKYAKG
jgi:hypothetical protein